MKITMINVGFGDCIILEDNKEIFIVDCGSKNFSKCNTLIKNNQDLSCYVKNYYIKQNDYKIALITHFHEDHISGFKEMASKNSVQFDKIYIPYLNIAHTNGQKILMELAVCYVLLFNTETKVYQLSYTLLNHVQWITKLTTNIKPVSRGDIITFANKRYKVLWPDTTMSYSKGIQEDIKILKELFEKYSFDIQKELLFLEQDIQEGMEYREFKHKKQEALTKNFNVTNEQAPILTRLLFLKTQHKDVLNRIREDFNAKRPAASSRFSKLQNKISVVFQDEIEEPDILMMGDVTKSVIRNKLKGDFSKKAYKLIKVPHHGTVTHYDSLIPKAGNLFISSGYSQHNKISFKYKKHVLLSTSIYCTCCSINCEGKKIKNCNCLCNQDCHCILI